MAGAVYSALPAEALRISLGGEQHFPGPADATGRHVVVGPYEATAAGNVLVQAMGAGDIKDQAQIRRTLAASSDLQTFAPTNPTAWDAAYDRYAKVLGK